MTQLIETAKSLYAAFAKGDVPTVLGGLAPNVRWTEAEGGPYGGTYVGPQAVLEGVFMKLGGEWDGFAAVPSEFFSGVDSSSNTVVALGEYSATFKATGKSFKAPFAHVWRFENGKVVAFQQHTDTAVHRRPMQ